MKKFAAMLMLVCSFGVFAVVGCGPDAKKDAPKPTVPAAPADKMTTPTPPAPPATPPATPPAAPSK